jgi:hypothetical protein
MIHTIRPWSLNHIHSTTLRTYYWNKTKFTSLPQPRGLEYFLNVVSTTLHHLCWDTYPIIFLSLGIGKNSQLLYWTSTVMKTFAIQVKIWVMAQCSVVVGYQRFRGSSPWRRGNKILQNYKLSQHYMVSTQKTSTGMSDPCENLKSCNLLLFPHEELSKDSLLFVIKFYEEKEGGYWLFQ